MISLFTEQHYIPRRHRANEAGGLYHALNRGNLRADNFRKVADLSRTTTTSLSFAATSSETPCERSRWIEPRIGVGDHCGDGNRSPSRIQNCCCRGRLHGCRTGWNGLTIRSQTQNWTQFACPLSEAVHWEMMSGWNQSPHASTSSQPSVLADGNKLNHNRNRQSKTPDPFDFSKGGVPLP